MMSGVSETVDYQLQSIFDSVNRLDQYLRVSPDLHNASPEMDKVSGNNLELLLEAGDRAVEKYRPEIDSFAEKLVH